ncbi:MAG: D-amino acid dehydrogenase [Hyphomicrobiales bacterium]
MRAVVLGAGVIGVTTAYELAKDGHEVMVIDRLAEPACETSFANAGLVAPGHSYTWSSPRAPGILWRSLFDKSQALRFKPSLDPRLLSWTLKFLRNCTAERARLNTKRKVRLCIYSQGELKRIASETGVAFDALEGGLLYLYRSPQSFERGAGNTRILAEEGLELRPVDRDEMARLDPALEPVKQQFAGAVFCPSDASGDAHVFTQNLAKYCAEHLGVTFRFGSEITGFATVGERVTGIVTNKGVVGGDEFVMCLGVFAPFLAKQLGVSLPIYPIKGYSVTLPLDGHNNPPTIGGVDEDNLVAYARFGDRIRATATAEFAGYDKSHRPADFSYMLGVMRKLFPDGANYEKPTYWAGLRPMTPEGTPIFGRGRWRNMMFNAGHGHMGWTMSAGSARIAADFVGGSKPAIDLAGMMLGE